MTDSIETLVGKLEELTKKATPGEWYYEGRSEILAPILDSFDGDRIIVADTLTVTRQPISIIEGNTKFITASANLARLLPPWLGKVKALRDNGLEELPQIRYAASGDDTEPSGYYVSIDSVRKRLTALLESPLGPSRAAQAAIAPRKRG